MLLFTSNTFGNVWEKTNMWWFLVAGEEISSEGRDNITFARKRYTQRLIFFATVSVIYMYFE